MSADSTTDDTDTVLAGTHAETPASLSQPLEGDTSRHTSIVNTNSRTRPRPIAGDAHSQLSFEPATQPSGQQQNESAPRQLGVELQRPEPVRLRSEPVTSLTPYTDDTIRRSKSYNSSKRKSTNGVSVSLGCMLGCSQPDATHKRRTKSSSSCHECETSELHEQFKNCADKKTEDNTKEDDSCHVSAAGAQAPPWHEAWVKTPNSLEYRHLVTGTVYRNEDGKPPKGPGPKAKDIPDGWEAYLPTKSEEAWSYLHRASGVTIDMAPTSLPEFVLENLEIAASYGELPRSCQAFLHHDRIAYKITCPGALCPVG
jgi:hypothetical protein